MAGIPNSIRRGRAPLESDAMPVLTGGLASSILDYEQFLIEWVSNGMYQVTHIVVVERRFIYGMRSIDSYEPGVVPGLACVHRAGIYIGFFGGGNG